MADLTADSREQRAPWVWIVLVATLFTALQVQYSLRHGRLATPPMYDDVMYFSDALERMDVIYRQGWLAFLGDYAHSPPHSPYSSLMALVGFLIFGIKDWAPCAVNVLPVIGLLWCANNLMCRTRAWQRGLAFIFVLTAPIASYMVTDCRPDFAWGLAAAMAVIIPLRSRFVGATFKQHLWVGTWLAAALLIKPSIFPLTLLSAGLAWLLASVADWMESPGDRFMAQTFQAWVRCATTTLILAGPHFLLNHKEIIAYTFSTAVGAHRKRSILEGDGRFQFDYFLYGSAGKTLLDWHLFIMLIVLVVAVGVLIYRAKIAKSDRGLLVRATFLGVVTFVTYLVPSIVALGNPFFGAEFDLLLILGSLMALRLLIVNASAWKLGWVGGVCALFAGTSGLVMSPAFPPDRSIPQTPAINAVVYRVSRLLNDNAPAGAQVFLTGKGWINNHNLMFLAWQQGKPLKIVDAASSDSMTTQIHGFDAADYVVAAEDGVGEYYGFLASAKLLDATLAAIRHRGDFYQIGAVQSETGKWIFIFGHYPKFVGWDGAANLGPPEGPYRKISVVRWGLYPATSVDFIAQRAGNYRLSARALAAIDGQVVTVDVDGKKLATHSFATAEHFESFDVQIPLTAGKHVVRLEYGKFAVTAADPRQRTALFEHLQILLPMELPPTTAPANTPAR